MSKHKAEGELEPVDRWLVRIAKFFFGSAVAIVIAVVILIGIRGAYAPTGYVPQATLRATAPTPTASARPAPATPTPTPSPVSFRSCREAGAAGALPLHEGDPGYSKKLDTDEDGRACENYD